MNTREFTAVLPDLFAEIVFGSPDTSKDTYMLNRGDIGLLGSLERISAEMASSKHAGGGSIAAHAEHLRYGFSLVNQWASGVKDPWKDADWTHAWKKSSVTEGEWRALRDALREEAEHWHRELGVEREISERAAHWVGGTVTHTAYHLGAIRQIDRATHGPSAEDERALKP